MKLKLKKSWNKNISTIFMSSAYAMDLNCTIKEISLKQVMANRNQYELISILEDNEHRNIDDKVIHIPLSQMNLEDWRPISDKEHVFYCMTGKRSSYLLSNLKDGVGINYSLKGGLKGI